MIDNPDPTTRFFQFIDARYEIYRRKEILGEPAPWTDDPVLARYRFTNVHREHDRVTRWIVENVLRPYESAEDAWMGVALGRFINWPPTLNRLIEEMVWPVDDFDADGIAEVIAGLAETQSKVYTGAYMIRAEPVDKDRFPSKAHYITRLVLQPLWDNRETVRRTLKEGVETATRFLADHYGWGTFMAGQVVTDLTYSDHWLKNAADLNTWTAVGPGSQRGLNRIYGYPLKTQWTDEEAVAAMRELYELAPLYLETVQIARLSDIQNCLCEFDKYERVRLGEGRPRAYYHPTTEY